MANENALIVQYNGVEVRSSHLISWDRTPVMQGPDFLYTLHRIHMMGTLHKGLSWQNGAAPVGEGTIDVQPQDVNFLLQKLQSPRKLLKIKLGTEEEDWITTKLDQNQGPQVIHQRLSNLIGVKQLAVELVIEFTTHKAKPAPNFLLSNRWEMVEDIDRNFRKRIMVRGRAIFRRDTIQLGGLEIDQFRKWVLWPLQRGYKRVHKSSGVGPTGVELFYETIDEQTYVDVLANDIVDIKVIHDYSHVVMSPERVAQLHLTSAAKSAARTLGRSSSDPVATGAGIGSEIALGAIEIGELTYSCMPRHVGRLVVWVKGTPHAEMKSLSIAANKIAVFRLAQLNLACPSIETQQSANFTDREVTIVATHEAAPVLGNLNIAMGVFGGSAVTAGGQFYSSELNVPGVATSLRHRVRFDAPQNGRGDGQTIVTIAKALISDEQTPPSGEQEVPRSQTTPLNLNAG